MTGCDFERACVLCDVKKGEGASFLFVPSLSIGCSSLSESDGLGVSNHVHPRAHGQDGGAEETEELETVGRCGRGRDFPA